MGKGSKGSTMRIKQKFHRQPNECQPLQGPQLKTGSYAQTIEFYGNIRKSRSKATSDEVQYLMNLIGLK